MAVKVAELYAELRADASKFTTGINKAVDNVNTSASKIENRWTKLGTTLGSTANWMATRVALPLIGAITATVYAASEAEDAVIAVSSALAARGENVEALTKTINEYADELQRVTVYDDEAIKRGTAFAINMGVQTSRIREVMVAAIGLASAYHIDLETAFKLVGRAAAGNTAMLGRYGIVLDESLSKEEKFNVLLEKGAGYMGVAEARANTLSGQLLVTKNMIGEASETIGAAFAPTLKKVADITKSVAEWLQKLSPATRNWAVSVAIAVTGLSLLLKVVTSLIGAYRMLITVETLAQALQGATGWLALAAGLAVAAAATVTIKNLLDDASKSMNTAGAAAAKQSENLLGDAKLYTSAIEDEIKAEEELMATRKEILSLSTGWGKLTDLWKRSMSISSKEFSLGTPPAAAMTASGAPVSGSAEAQQIAFLKAIEGNTRKTAQSVTPTLDEYGE